MNQVKNLCSVLYPNQCCQKILIEHVIEKECFEKMIVKSLGYGIIFGSTMVKLPQLLKLLSAKSGLGVSLISVLLELLALSFSSSYSYASGFPFSAWGEALFLLVMTSLVAFLIIYYDIGKGKSILFMFAFSIAISVLMSGMVPIQVLRYGQMLALPLTISSKLVQALANFKNGHTGQLSAITIILIFLGSTARIFTSIRETGDQLIITGFMLATVVNILLVFQIFFYWKTTNEFIRKNLSKKEK